MNESPREEFHNCFLCKHPMLKHILVGLLIFLGAYSAFYVVTDWHFKRMLDPALQMRRMNNAIVKEERQFDKMARKEFQRQNRLDRQVSSFVHVEREPDFYRIIINLNPFDNNEKNVEIRTEGNNLIINAAGERNTRNHEQIIKYSQTFAFKDKIDASKIIKVREGNNYIITVPTED